MSDFRIGSIASSSVLHVYSQRDSIWTDPPYQRVSDVWPVEKRQLLIDSILNGYDMPKLYFHEFYPPKEVDGKRYKYSIVDGKQRMSAVFGFIEGRFALDKDFECLGQSDVRAGGLTYGELAREYPELKTKFDGFVLPIVSILTEDLELIEDMFSRLNEAVPLNAAEKRNAFGGPVPGIVREFSNLPFFRAKLPFTNRRYRHYDLIAKFLYLAEAGKLLDTKKTQLDEFVRKHSKQGDSPAIDEAKHRVEVVLSDMTDVFIDSDPLLKSVGTVVLYFNLFMIARRDNWLCKVNRSSFQNFEDSRKDNRRLAEEGSDARYELLEYDRLSQSPNDAIALRFRFEILLNAIRPPTTPTE